MPPTPQQPPACAECQTTTQYAQGGAPQQSASRMTRSGDGRMRIDTGSTSVITDPRTQQAMVLDHARRTASFMPMSPTPPQAGPPQVGGAAPPTGGPAMPAVGVQSLGRSVINGQQVDGTRFVVQPPPQAPGAPQAPDMPQVPGTPQAPSAPQAAGTPQAPGSPKAPTVVDVWTSILLGIPVLTQVSGPFGQQTSYCQAAPSGEPHPGLFQVPPGYTPVMPLPPSAPR